MPATTNEPIPAPHQAAIAAWLHQPANRTDRFLNSVYEGSLRYGRMTASQAAAVRRNMIERGWRFAASGEVIAPDSPVSADVPTGEPADWNQAVPILNGEYEITTGDINHRFRIFTITRTSTDGLRHKRVLSWYSPEEYDWETFAYLTTDGRLKIWRRYQERSSEQWVLFARQLLHMLRIRESNGHEFMAADGLGVTWRVQVAHYNCRYCTGQLGAGYVGRGHDNCVSYLSFGDPELPNNAARPHNVDLSRPSPAASTASRLAARTRQQVEVHTYSELGSGWEQ